MLLANMIINLINNSINSRNINKLKRIGNIFIRKYFGSFLNSSF